VLAETGGIGKTALAETYVLRHQGSFALVAWFDMQRTDEHSSSVQRSDQPRPSPAERLATVDAAYASLGTDLGWCQQDDDVITQVDATRRGFERLDLPVLLVFDNVEDPADIDLYKPRAGKARALVTTRYDHGWVGRGLKRIDVKALNDEEGAKVLLRRIAGEDAAFAEDDGRWASHADWDQAKHVSERLGGLPLALNQIGSLIHQRQFDLVNFDEVYDASKREVLSRWGDGPLARHGENEVVWTTWNMSLRAAVEEAKHAELLLQLLALMNPTGIDRSIADDALATAKPDISDFERVDTFTALCAFNLIEEPRETGDVAITMHPLLREVTVEAMGALGAVQGKPDDRYRAIYGAIELHRLGAADHRRRAEALPAWMVETLNTLNWNPSSDSLLIELGATRLWCCELLRSMGFNGQAVQLGEHVLTDREEILGTNHPDTLTTRADLAVSYRSAGRTNDAIKLFEQVLADSEEILGTNHPNTLTTRANLATSYRSAGRTNDAIKLQEQILADSEEILGTNHPNTLTTRANLANSYRSAGRTNDAIKLMEQVADSAPRVLGPDHPDVALFEQFLEALRDETQR